MWNIRSKSRYREQHVRFSVSGSPRRSLEIKTSLAMNATIGNVTVASHVVADSQYVVVEEMFILRSVLGAARHQPLQLSAHIGHTNV